MGSSSVTLGTIVGLGLGIGIAFVSGCAPVGAEATAPLAAAPIPLVPEAYTVLPAAVAPATAQPARTRSLPAPAPALALEGRTMPTIAVKFDQYHPSWVVDVH
jgi:hypothetical protein